MIGHLNEYAKTAYLIVAGEAAKINQKSLAAAEIYKYFTIEWRINAKTAAYTIHDYVPIFWKMIVWCLILWLNMASIEDGILN